MERCDVVVVGAGLAGLACARELATAGLTTVLVDQKRGLGERVHTTGIFVRRTLEDFALPERCLGPVIRDVVLYSPRRRALALRSPHDEFRVGRMAMLYDHMRADGERSGVRCRLGNRVAALAREGDGVRVELEPVDAPAGTRRRQLIARMVIGADGARSRVAAAMGLDRNQRFLVGAEEVHPSASPGGPPVMHCFVDPRLAPGYLAWVVDDGEEAHVGVAGEPAAGYHPLRALATFRAGVADLVPVGAVPRERRGGSIPIGGLLRRIAEPRALLVGDAAGAVSPLTAGGLDPCLRQSRLAAQVVVAWLSSGCADALAAYQVPALRRRFRGRMLLRHVMSRLRGELATEVAVAVLRTPPFTAVAGHIFFGRGSFPDLELAPAAGP
jgi:flavin-dependent dehydrogenase